MMVLFGISLGKILTWQKFSGTWECDFKDCALLSLEGIRKNNTHSYININLLQIFTTRLQTYLRKKTVIRTDGSIAMNERYYINFEWCKTIRLNFNVSYFYQIFAIYKKYSPNSKHLHLFHIFYNGACETSTAS